LAKARHTNTAPSHANLFRPKPPRARPAQGSCQPLPPVPRIDRPILTTGRCVCGRLGVILCEEKQPRLCGKPKRRKFSDFSTDLSILGRKWYLVAKFHGLFLGRIGWIETLTLGASSQNASPPPNPSAPPPPSETRCNSTPSPVLLAEMLWSLPSPTACTGGCATQACRQAS
jgi:hypothetical protein